MLRSRKRSCEQNKLETDSVSALPIMKHESPSMVSGRRRRKTHFPPSSFFFIIGVAIVILILLIYLIRCYTHPRTESISDAILFNSPYIITQDELHRIIDSMETNSAACVMTISAWRDYGFVRNLYESLVLSENNETSKCFLWFVADDPFVPNNSTTAQILYDLKTEWDHRFPIVTFQLMEQQLGDLLDPFASIAFASSADQEGTVTAALIPFAYLYAFQVLGLSSVIYIKKDLWVSDTLSDIISSLSTYDAVLSGTTEISRLIVTPGGFTVTNVVTHSTYKGTFDIDFMALEDSVSTQRVLSKWMDLMRIPIAKGQTHNWNDTFAFSFFSYHLNTKEMKLLMDERYQPDIWDHNRGVPSHSFSSIFVDFKEFSTLNKTQIKRMMKEHGIFHANKPPTTKVSSKNVLPMYLQLWIQKHSGSYYRTIPFGFNHFSDGTIIEPWMHQVYQTLIQPVQMDGEYMGISDIAISKVDVYTRLQFQKDGCKNPFLSSTGSMSMNPPVIFMNWLLRGGPLDQVVDMDGLYYFSVVEEYVAKGVQYPYPVPKSFLDFSLIEPSETDHDPTGTHYDEFKIWFEVNVASSSLVSARFQNLVGSSNMFHRENHWLYHRKLSSTSDLGLNMIGWHGGIFGLGIQASKLYLAAQASGLWANAVPLKPMLLSDSGPKYLHPNNMKYNLTRSCSEATNVVFVNADHTRNAQQVIPELIWRYKYTIGYFEWELDVFPQHWMSLMQEYDEVWVSTTFIAHSIMNTPGYPKIPIKVVPIPLAFHDSGPSKLTDIEDPSGLLYEVMKVISDEAFVFLVVFDFWSCAERKNPEAAIRSFLDAFPLESDMEYRHHLIIKSQNGTPDQLEILRNKTLDDPRIHLLSYLITTAELNELQSRADCYVSLHRSEGFGMNILEEMGNGVPVIATNYSGNVDFFPAVQDYIGKCIFAVPYILIEINETIGGYEAGNHWAEPDHDFAVESMRIVAKNDCKKKYGNKISHQVMQNFGMDAVGRKMKQALVESFDRIQRKQESFLENRRRMI